MYIFWGFHYRERVCRVAANTTRTTSLTRFSWPSRHTKKDNYWYRHPNVFPYHSKIRSGRRKQEIRVSQAVRSKKDVPHGITGHTTKTTATAAAVTASNSVAAGMLLLLVAASYCHYAYVRRADVHTFCVGMREPDRTFNDYRVSKFVEGVFQSGERRVLSL